MVTNLFNGRVYLLQSSKRGGFFDIRLVAFADYTGYFKGSDAQVGDVVFLRGMDGKGQRLVITAISSKSISEIVCTVEPESQSVRYLPQQVCAIVRETPNRKYPQFPVGLPQAIRSIMESYYAWLADFAFEDCSDNLLTAADLTGDETLCGLTLPNGLKRGITLSELRKWMHTWTLPNGSDMQMNVLDTGQFNGVTPPQY